MVCRILGPSRLLLQDELNHITVWLVWIGVTAPVRLAFENVIQPSWDPTAWRTSHLSCAHMHGMGWGTFRNALETMVTRCRHTWSRDEDTFQDPSGQWVTWMFSCGLCFTNSSTGVKRTQNGWRMRQCVFCFGVFFLALVRIKWNKMLWKMRHESSSSNSRSQVTEQKSNWGNFKHFSGLVCLYSQTYDVLSAYYLHGSEEVKKTATCCGRRLAALKANQWSVYEQTDINQRKH